MALIQCPECSGQVSTTLEACPHCGFQLAQNPSQPPPVGRRADEGSGRTDRSGKARQYGRRKTGQRGSPKTGRAWDTVDNKGLPPSIKAGWTTLVMGWVFFALPIPILSTWIGGLFCSVSLIVSIVAIAQGHAGTGMVQVLLNVIGSPLVWFVSSIVWLSIFAGATS